MSSPARLLLFVVTIIISIQAQSINGVPNQNVGANMVSFVGGFGGNGNGTTFNNTALTSAISSGNSIFFPAGNYLIDNSAQSGASGVAFGPFAANQQFVFDPGAYFSCSFNDRPCLLFNGGSHNVFTNFSIRHATASTIYCNTSGTGTYNASSGVCRNVLFVNMSDPVFNNVYMLNVFGIALAIENTPRPILNGVKIVNCTSVGVYMNHDQDEQGNNIEVSGCGDDALGDGDAYGSANPPQYTLTSSSTPAIGGVWTNLIMRNVGGACIDNSGKSNVHYINLECDTTGTQGYVVYTDNTGIGGTYFHVSNSTLSHFHIAHTGQNSQTINTSAIGDGIAWSGSVGAGTLTIQDGIIESTNGSGIWSQDGGTPVRISNVVINNAGLNAAASTSHQNCLDLEFMDVALNGITETGCMREGVYLNQDTYVSLRGVRITNAWTKGVAESGANALEANLNTFLTSTDLTIVDNQSTATGYTLLETGTGNNGGFWANTSLSILHGTATINSAGSGSFTNFYASTPSSLTGAIFINPTGQALNSTGGVMTAVDQFGDVSSLSSGTYQAQINNGGVSVASENIFAFSSTTQAYNAPDTAFSRTAAGTVSVGNGTAGDATGSLQLAKIKVGAISYSGTAPTIAAGTGAGTSPTGVAIVTNSTTNGGGFTITTGTSPVLSATLATITFNASFQPANAVFCQIWPTNAATARLAIADTPFVSSAASATAFVVSTNSTAIAASTAYAWGYSCQ